jgi:hypothetical protein
MKNLRRLGAALALMLVLGLSAFAGDTATPPCAPGDTATPPCTNAPATADDGVVPSDLSSDPAATAGPDYSVTGVAVDILESLLSIF